MKLPAASELVAATQSFERDWAGVDRVLYDLCTKHMEHANRAHVVAKLVLIDRGYAAGLERCVSPPKGTQAISVIADFVGTHGDDIDEILAPLAAISEPLTVADMETIVLAHARLLKLLRRIPTNGRTPRSFASKYLHFHYPVVPIYDDYACRGLTRMVRWDSKVVPLSVPTEPDDEYFEFCVRFWRLYDACLQEGLAVTVKTLDHFLWQVRTWNP